MVDIDFDLMGKAQPGARGNDYQQRKRVCELIGAREPLDSPSPSSPCVTPTSFIRATRCESHSLSWYSARLKLECLFFSLIAGVRKERVSDTKVGFTLGLLVEPTWVSTIAEDN